MEVTIKPFRHPAVNAGREHLPHACGVYIMRDAGHEVIYVGKAKDLAKRVAQYFNPSKQDRKTTLLAPLIRKIDYIPCSSERESLIWERKLIRRYQPFFNSMWKDDKSYPYVKISLDEDFPRIFLTRHKNPGGRTEGLYFGPYPKVAPVKSLLRYLWERRLFPLRPCRWDFSVRKPLARMKIKSCLYYHTEQCPAPCAGRVSREDYRLIAENAALFFKGKFKDLSRSWRDEMQSASRRLDFERAAELRDNLKAVEHMEERVRYEAVEPRAFERRLESSRAATELQKVLTLPKPPHHIEAFDISHFSGKQTVASMVCFMGGEPFKDHYRRLRIRTVAGVDDFRSIKEAVSRRYKRLSTEGEALPDLVLIDGGKGQLAMAVQAIREVGTRLPAAALAKRIEEVFVPHKSEPILLERSSPALRLLQRLRDEAHRFAVTYHRLLRKKKLLG